MIPKAQGRVGMLQSLEEKIRRDVSLALFTTIRIGGAAQFFYQATTTSELCEGLNWAAAQSVPVNVLGGGSNVLVADQGVRGLVIKSEARNFEWQGSELVAESGAVFAAVAKQAADLGWSGFECGIGIPGTLGGAIFGNASNFLGSVSDHLKSVEIFDPVTQTRRVLSKTDCGFSYRESRFKTSKEIILSATFELKKKDPSIIRADMDRILEYKSKTQKTPYPTSGCMFKNPKVLTAPDRARAAAFGLDDLIRFSDDMNCEMLPFRQLLERAGLKGHRIGGLMISDVNANFMLNMGGATAENVLKMIMVIQETIREKFRVELQLEIQTLGFDS